MSEEMARNAGELFIGVDLGGTNIRVRCADRDGTILNEENLQTTARPFGKTLEENLIGVIEKAAAGVKAPNAGVKAIGMGVPGIYYGHRILMSPNIDTIDVDRLLRHFHDKGVAFHILNDVKCAAMGEQWKGEARDCRNFILINLGTGVSVAPVVEGRVLSGEHCAAGEIAYWISDVGSTAGFGEGRVPLEEKFSGRWLGENVKRRLRALKPEGWTEERIEAITTKEIFALCYRGDAAVKETVDDAVRYFATALADICILLDPETLIFSGGITADLDYFFEDLRSYLQKTVPFPPKLIRSSLNGEAGIYGAIAMAIQGTSVCWKGTAETL